MTALRTNHERNNYVYHVVHDSEMDDSGRGHENIKTSPVYLRGGPGKEADGVGFSLLASWGVD